MPLRPVTQYCAETEVNQTKKQASKQANQPLAFMCCHSLCVFLYRVQAHAQPELPGRQRKTLSDAE